MVQVLLWEMDSWSGRKLDEIKEFATIDKAKTFVDKFNSTNTADVTPSWYMYAEISKVTKEN